MLPIAGLLAGIASLASRRLRPVGLCLVTLAVVGLRPSGYLPIMFVIAALPFAAVALAGCLQRMTERLTAPWAATAQRLTYGVLAAVVAMSLLSLWAPRYAVAYTAEPNADFRAAVDYLSGHAEPNSRVLVDDAYWAALVDRGWGSDGWEGAIWYYKLDLDPIARDRALPHGWRDVDYLIANDQIRNGVAAPEYRQLREAYDHSVVLASWGSGERLIEVRRVRG